MAHDFFPKIFFSLLHEENNLFIPLKLMAGPLTHANADENLLFPFHSPLVGELFCISGVKLGPWKFISVKETRTIPSFSELAHSLSLSTKYIEHSTLQGKQALCVKSKQQRDWKSSDPSLTATDKV